MSTLDQVRGAIIGGAADEAVAHIAQALEEGTEASAILNEALIPAMAEVGRRFEEGEYFVPEMLIAARATRRRPRR